jgi:hypothetical protein
MKPQRASAFADAEPVGRGHRRPETLSALNRRDELIREAVAVYFPGASANEAAHRLHTALHRYECGAWRRDRVSDVMPLRHAGRIAGHCWQILRVIERTPKPRSIRLILRIRCQ